MARTKDAPAPAGEVAGSTPPVEQEETVVTAITVPTSSGAVVTLDDVQTLMLADAEEDLGFEKGDVAIPFLRVLQSNSPQVKRQNAKYVEGAEGGMFFNTATNWTRDGQAGIFVVPVTFKRQATLWLPRGENGGGGFVAEIPMQVAEELLPNCTKSDKGKDMTPAFTGEQIASMNPQNPRIPQGFDKGALSCELVISAMYYVLIVDPEVPGSVEPVAFPLSSTQLKKSRTWNALINNARLPNPSGPGAYRPAMFAFAYKLTTVPESNAKGDWMGVRITQDRPLIKYIEGKPTEVFPGGAQVYLAARDFKALVSEGKVKVAQEEPDVEIEHGGNDEDEPTPF